MFYFDPRYLILVGPTIILAMIASAWVQSAFAKWKRVANSSGMTGAEAAATMLRRAGLHDVEVEETRGMLSDHYDPRTRTLRLSPDVYEGRSVASVGVALHEAGHALQHSEHYAWLGLRTALVPVVSIGGGFLPWILIMIGLAIRPFHELAVLGVLVFAAAVVFSFITLPVEWNASSRAKEACVRLGVVSPGVEARGVAAVLNAAALTYVAAAITAAMQLLYYALLVFGNRRN